MPKSSTTMVTSSQPGTSVTYMKTLVKERTATELDQFKKEISIDDHSISLKQLAERYNTDLQEGLCRVKAGELLKINGPNCLIPSATKSRLVIFAEFMFGGFATLLWIGAILSTVGYLIAYYRDDSAPYDQLYLAGVLVTVTLITGLFGYYQESANTAIMESFKKMIPKYARVIRDGQVTEIASEELVIGDLVEVQSGDCVPADIRLITCRGVKVDNSSITGEPEMQTRSTECTDNNPLETQNLAFYGTNIVEGFGTGLVIATGDNTLMGHIAGLTSGIEPDEMPIKKELKNFTKILTIMAVSIGTVFFVVSLSIGYNFFEAFIFLIAIIVANVPEGLLVTLTACLTLTAKRMANKNCLVKHLQAIETLGSTSVICSDKTGTLTQNHMTVSHMFYDNVTLDAIEKGDHAPRSPAFKNLCRVGILCNRAEFKPGQEKVPILKRQVQGDASESGILKAMELLIGDVMKQRSEMPKVCEIPFTSTNKYQLSIHHLKDEHRHLLVMKGAPERIIEQCSTYFYMGNDLDLNEEERKYIKKTVLQLGYMGERVLGFADLELPKNKYPDDFKFSAEKPNFPLKSLRFVGLISLIDPPRSNVPDAVEKCKSAGIRVIMVTGDHPVTAVAIAKKVGILSPQSVTTYDIAMKKNISATNVTEAEKSKCTASVVTGGDLRGMVQEELDEILMNYWEIVFARTSPQQKLKIVESLQRLGSIVAVTGDGVNDSPALKKADIGIAMGIAGSDVAKEAADMILLDDNFASIVTGVEEGRLIFDNLKKSIFYILTSNVPEVVPFMLFVTLNIPQPLSVLAILLIDVGTDLWPGISLAYEKAEADIMRRMPRDPTEDKLVTNRLICFAYCQIGVIQACAGFVTWFFTMAQYGFFYDRLIGIREEWDAEFINDLVDSYGQEWTYAERKILEKKGYSAFFLAIVVTQVADAIIVKTRRLSLCQQGMTNWVLNFGLIFEVVLAITAVYCPGINTALQLEPVEWYTFIPSIPFALIIFFYDEGRRYCLRKNPNGWLAKETYY